MRATNLSTKARRILSVTFALLLSTGVIVLGVGKPLSFIARETHPPTFDAGAAQADTVAAHSAEALPVRAAAQTSSQIDLPKNVISNGGGLSTNGSFTVNGTVGQPAAGTRLSGGQYSLAGGFWQPDTDTSAPTPTPPSSPTPSPTPTATATPTSGPSPSPAPNLIQFSASNYAVQEDCTTLTVAVDRIGDTSANATVEYFTSDGSANERGDYITALGTLRFAPGETSKTFVVLINEDTYVEGPETFNVGLRNPVGASLGAPAVATVTIEDDPVEPLQVAIDDPRTYVCQHYHDFLNRQPDQGGWDFWTNEIASCGTNQTCIDTRRINVSAAFYLSIEFQNTGFLVERMYKAAYGDDIGQSTWGGPHQLSVPTVQLREFLLDTQEIGRGVIVNQPGWETILESNKASYAATFVQQSRFINALPQTMTSAQFVDRLNSNAGNPLTPAERDQLVTDLNGAVKTRAQVLRAIAEHPNLVTAEFNRAFVLMQYFGYLRRNVNDPPDTDYTGYDFWLTKLNAFNGNFQDAEMVKAFVSSIEYRHRFGS